MNYQMTRLQKLVEETLTTVESTKPTAQLIEKWLQEITKISEGLFQAIREEVFSQVNERLVERHLQQTQNDGILLLQVLAQ